MILEKLVKQAFIDRLGLNPGKNAIETFTRRFFDKHNIGELLTNSTDADYLDALKASAVESSRNKSRADEDAEATPEPSTEKTTGGRK